MDASYDDIQLQVEVPVRVFSAKCNSVMSLIYFDYFGKPAQITILAENQDDAGADYQIRRRLLHMLAQNLEPKSNFCMAVKYIPIASQIEDVLTDVMLDSVPSFSTSLSLSGLYPLEWFLSMGRQRFLLTEVVHGKVCAVGESGWPDQSPATGDLPPLPQNLLSLSTKDLKVNPSRCGKNRICGSINIDLHPTDINAADIYQYTFVCMRDIGACAAFEGSHRAMAYQIRQLDLIDGYCQVLSPEERRAVCVPRIRACLFYEFPRHPVPGKLLVGAIFDDLPRLTPLRNSNAPLEVVRKCVLKICKTVEWLADKGIGWGGSVGYPATHKGQALLDAAVVDAFGRPWLMEGFTDVEGKIASDRFNTVFSKVNGSENIDPAELEPDSCHRSSSTIAERLYVFHGMVVGNHVEVIFGLNMKTFRLSVSPFPREKPSLPAFAHTCNAIVQLVLRGTKSEWKYEIEQIQDILSTTPKVELLEICHETPETPRLCYVQSYLSHGPRSCELGPGEGGKAVLRLTNNIFDSNSDELDREDEHFASLHVTTGFCKISASQVSITSTDMISSSRICGEVYRTGCSSNHCIAARNARARGAQRWSCPELQQLIVRKALQASCAANPFEGCRIRVPELLACIYDDDLEWEKTIRPSRIVGGLYQTIQGVPLSEFIDSAWQGDSKVRLVAGQISGMMESLHRLGFVWGGRYKGGQEAKTLTDCIVVDQQCFAWLVDGFGATYDEEVVHSDCQALISLLKQMKVDDP